MLHLHPCTWAENRSSLILEEPRVSPWSSLQWFLALQSLASWLPGSSAIRAKLLNSNSKGDFVGTSFLPAGPKRGGPCPAPRSFLQTLRGGNCARGHENLGPEEVGQVRVAGRAAPSRWCCQVSLGQLWQPQPSWPPPSAPQQRLCAGVWSHPPALLPPVLGQRIDLVTFAQNLESGRLTTCPSLTGLSLKAKPCSDNRQRGAGLDPVLLSAMTLVWPMQGEHSLMR